MRMGSVGRSYPHFETVILNPDQDGVGEIVTRGRYRRFKKKLCFFSIATHALYVGEQPIIEISVYSHSYFWPFS